MSIFCTILPTTKRLKQLIKQHGTQWMVITPIQKVQCFDGELGVKICSIDKEHERWVRYPKDIKF